MSKPIKQCLACGRPVWTDKDRHITCEESMAPDRKMEGNEAMQEMPKEGRRCWFCGIAVYGPNCKCPVTDLIVHVDCAARIATCSNKIER